MGLEEAVEKLRTLEVFPNTIGESAEIFRDCATTEALAREMGRRHYSCGYGQFIYFHLKSVMEKDPEFKKIMLAEALQNLVDTGIKPQHIEEYILQRGVPLFSYEQEYERDVRSRFYQRADQFALDKMREWLGVKQKS